MIGTIEDAALVPGETGALTQRAVSRQRGLKRHLEELPLITFAA